MFFVFRGHINYFKINTDVIVVTSFRSSYNISVLAVHLQPIKKLYPVVIQLYLITSTEAIRNLSKLW